MACPHHVEQASANGLADGNSNGLAGGNDGLAALQAVGRVHRNGTHATLAQVLLHLQDEIIAVLAVDAQGIQNVGHAVGRELGVDNRADDLNDGALGFCRSYFHGTRSVVRVEERNICARDAPRRIGIGVHRRVWLVGWCGSCPFRA